jgi:hypothetical protein
LLERSRERLFVGRETELAALERFLDGERRRVFHVQGMGGIGKTELLRAFARTAKARGWEVAELDARDLPRTADAVGAALLGAGARDARRLVVLDSFELLSALEQPLRDKLLPALPARWRIVLAGREHLGSAWTADPGWSEHLEVLELGELSPDEGRDYLGRKQVAPDRVEEVLELAGGVPLALALVAEAVGETGPGELEADPDLTEAMVQRLVDQVPSPAHHRALATSALVLHTTEELLAATGGDPALFDWLASRPFFHRGARGIYPHDLVRRMLTRRLRWRQPELFVELIVAAGEHQARRLRSQLGSEAAGDTTRELMFIMSQSAVPMVVDSYYRYRSTELRVEDWPVLEAIIAAQAGPTAIGHLRRWREHPAFEYFAARRGDLALEGFFVGIRLDRLSPAEAGSVPGVDVFSDRFGPFDRPCPYVWMWGDRRAGHGVSATQTLAMDWIASQLLAEPGSPRSAMAVQDGNDWIHTDMQTSPRPVAECAFELGETRYVVIHRAHEASSPLEWYLDMVHEWLEMLRGAAGSSPPAGGPAAGAILDALKSALRQADRPDLLGDSALLELHVLAERAAYAGSKLERGRALAGYLRELARDTLQSPRDEVAYQILERTYFEPAAKQRAVAAELGLGYSTYRRHLATTIERLADALLQHELAARARSAPRDRD